MNTWKTTVQPARRSVRLLMTDPEQNEVLKAALPLVPQHPRALLTLLESLSLWVGQPLTAAVSAEPSVDRRCAEALFGDGFLPLDSALVRFDTRNRPVNPSSRPIDSGCALAELATPRRVGARAPPPNPHARPAG